MWWMVALFACSPNDSDTDVALDTRRQPAALAVLSSGSCPDLSDSGASTFTSNGVEREVRVYFPDDMRDGLPVLFYFHPLGSNAAQVASWLNIADFANENDLIVVVPESLDQNLMEWEFLTADAPDDLALFDDMRTCLSNEHHIDLRRVYASGMSAGGLWTTYLSTHRGDTLASVLVMSGGTEPVQDYFTPAYKFPALLMWGGENDTWGNQAIEVNFQDTMMDYSAKLRADGHFVVHCDHGMGHTIPPEGRDLTADWLLPHVYGEPSPWEGQDIATLLDYCVVPE